MSLLDARFDLAARSCGATHATSEVFAQVDAAYREPHRGYHDLTHMLHCLAVLDGVRDILTAPAEVELAIWFHDIVYEPKPGADNEGQSAAVARAACAQMGIATDVAGRIATMVLATADHLLPAGEATDGDVAAFLDIDLSVLGEDDATFERFERGVRLEYGWVPEDVYVEKRAEVLRGFLARDQVYFHPVLRARYETRARENLARAVAALAARRR